MKCLLVGADGLDCRAYQVFSQRPRAAMRSHVPYTGPAWTSIYTGLPATVHSVLDPHGKASKLSRSSKEWADHCVWASLGAEAGIWSMPTAYPTKDLAFYVPGFPYLDEMKGLCTEQLGEAYWKEMWWIEEAKAPGGPHDTLARIDAGHTRMVNLFIEACQKHKVEFGAVGFRFPDRLGHLFGNADSYWGIAERGGVWLVEKFLDQLVAELQPDAWVLVSDHGIYKLDHRALGVIAMGGALEEVLQSRRWWSTRDPAHIIAEYLGVELPALSLEEVLEAERESLRVRYGTHMRLAPKLVEALTSPGLRLCLGSGGAPQDGEGWVNIDVAPHPGVDLLYDLEDGLPFPDQSVDEILARDVLEHFSYHIVSVILGDWCRVLRPGGVIEVRCPDLEALCKGYASGELSYLRTIQGLYGGATSMDFDTHYTCLDFEWLQSQLAWWGCTDIERLDDPDQYAVRVRAVKSPVEEVLVDERDLESLEDRRIVEKRLVAYGYIEEDA